ncbi:MAG: hypothetical protein CVU39_15810 [Chloroflexi bacterium HGW-Chloroflexi-10]|nr:MAG: hypothetical protein CVU39_15810 [Chloroflexi bacterium HGW-Chloroflexi-10]
MASDDQFSAKYEITSELFGKANPNNFSCCTEFQFNNNSDTELMVFEHWILENDNTWSINYYSQNNTNQPLNCTNYYSQHDGKTTYWSGLTEIIVIYANPHCEWIELDKPKLKNYIVSIIGPCAP